MKILGLVLAAGLATLGVACGDDKATPDAPKNIDAAIDAPIIVVPPTFTSFVIDLVLHQTADNTAPKPFSDFSQLPDNDQDNPAAYASLFQ